MSLIQQLQPRLIDLALMDVEKAGDATRLLANTFLTTFRSSFENTALKYTKGTSFLVDKWEDGTPWRKVYQSPELLQSSVSTEYISLIYNFGQRDIIGVRHLAIRSSDAIGTTILMLSSVIPGVSYVSACGALALTEDVDYCYRLSPKYPTFAEASQVPLA